MTTAASLDSTSVRLVPGEEVVVPLQIRNNGSVVEFYEFEVVGPPREWTDVARLEQGVLPGTTTTTTVTFRPPRSAVVPAGELRFGVVVTPTERPDLAVVPEGVVEVLPFFDTGAELVPRTSQGSRGGKHQVAIDNRGNVPVAAMLRGADEGRKVDVACRPPAVTVNPGEAVFVDVRVRPRKRFLRGQPVTLPFVVFVEPQDSPPVQLQGSYVQGPVLPPWFLKALVAVLAALVALALLWFVVLKPTIESQAEEAVAEEVAAAEQAAEQAEQAAEDAEEAAPQTDPGPTAGPDDGTDDGEGPQTGPTPRRARTIDVPFARRLNSSGGDPGVFTVPTDSTLQIADLVVSNPQGDFGRATISVDGDALFPLALENFRDLDYHFVSPITLTEGQQLSLNVLCREPGHPPGAARATSCDISLYVGGTLTQPAPRRR